MKGAGSMFSNGREGGKGSIGAAQGRYYLPLHFANKLISHPSLGGPVRSLPAFPSPASDWPLSCFVFILLSELGSVFGLSASLSVLLCYRARSLCALPPSPPLPLWHGSAPFLSVPTTIWCRGKISMHLHV